MKRFTPARLNKYLLVALTALCAAAAVTAFASALLVTSGRLTVSQSATSVPCVEAVTISNNAFTPASVTIPQGCSVRWTHTTNTNHSSTSNADTGNTVDPWDSGVFTQASATNPFTRVFNVTGTFNYYCSIHKNNMTGIVTVN